MKTYRSLPNNSNGIFPVSFSVRSPFVLRSSSVRAPFILRSISVRSPFELRSSSVDPPFELRSSSVRAPFILRSISVRSPFELRSSSVDPPFELRSSSVHPPFNLRSGIEDRSKNDRRNIGESSEARRRCIETLTGSQGRGDPNKNFIFTSNDILKSVRQCDTKNIFSQ